MIGPHASGAGDASSFETNLKRFCPRAADVDIWSRDSLSLNTADIQRCLDKYGPFAMFSIDGGHTVEHTSNNLKFAEAVSASFGVIFVDDYYNSHWPGVHIGVARPYTLSSPRFVPFAYVRDKLLLTSFTRHSRYLRMFQENAADWQDVKMVNMFGYRVISFNFVP